MNDTDHENVEEFVRALAKATTYDSRDTGSVIIDYWKEEAKYWVAKWERLRPVSEPGEGEK